MIKDEKLRSLIESARNQTKRFALANGVEIEIPRLTINDCARIEKELGINLFGLLTEMAQGGAAKTMSYEFQRTIFYQALKKLWPEITIEDAGDIMTAMDAVDLGRALAWILVGREPPTA